MPPEIESKADELISRYPVSKRSASLPLLHLVQEHFGLVSDDAIHWIAGKLDLQPINILELVTFYPMFRRKPAGRTHIRVCRTLSCAMAGSERLMENFCKMASIRRSAHAGHGDPVSVSDDGRYSIESVECLASCGTGPVCMINDEFHEAVTDEQVPALLRKYE